MCGIAGFIDNQYTGTKGKDLMGKVLQSIKHRGPDGSHIFQEGAICLGHNRLSIIDLSHEADQPMHGWGSTIVFNGEIYNYLELKKVLELDGYIFKTQSDTEVLLALYHKHGDQCVQYCAGMWAFAIWNHQKQILFCSRDRFGIKPFYYYRYGDKFYFGSELKIFQNIPQIQLQINEDQCIRGLQLGWTSYKSETYYSNIHQIEPAHNLIWQNDQISHSKYWDIAQSSPIQISEEEAISQFRHLFDQSIQQHMRSDVSVGSCLSGGLDSSTIVSSVASLYPSSALKTFTIYYTGDNAIDERPFARLLSEKYPNVESHYMEPSEESIRESYADYTTAQDVPIGGSSPYSQYFVMRLAAENGIKVVLDGQGSDELMAGYLHAYYRVIGSHLRSTKPWKALSLWNQLSRAQEYSLTKKWEVLGKSLLSTLLSEQDITALELNKGKVLSLDFPKQKIALAPFPSQSALNTFLYQSVFQTSLSHLLHFEDRNSMRFSIESRVPFLDHRLVEFLFSLPDHFKIRGTDTKYILRQSQAPILPSAIALRKDKKGFVTPGEVKWLRGPLRFILDQPLTDLPYLKNSKVREIIAQYQNGDNKNARWIWRYFALQDWLHKQ